MMAIVFGAPMPFKKATVAVAYAPDPAQIRKVHGEPVSITLSAVAVGMSRGTCFWVTAGKMGRGFSLGVGPRVIGTMVFFTPLGTPCTGLLGLPLASVLFRPPVFSTQPPPPFQLFRG